MKDLKMKKNSKEKVDVKPVELTFDAVIEKYHPGLIISVDHGISAREQIQYASNNGVPVIITDHHTILIEEIQKELNTNPVLGIYYLPITKAYALMNNLPIESGALIYSPSAQQGLAIIANSPAANAGLKLDDIIIAVSGEKIDAQKTLPDLLYEHKKGEEIELTILRNSQEMPIKVQL